MTTFKICDLRFAIGLTALLTLPALASNYLVYNPSSSPVANQVVRYDESYLRAVPGGHAVLTYSLKPAASNWNGVLPSLASNAATIGWCKVSAGVVVAMSAGESNSIVTAQTNAVFAAKQARELAAKLAATNAMVNFFGSPEGRAMFAGWEATLDQFNVVRTNPTAVLPALTLTQLTNAIKTRINAQVNSQ